MRAAETKSKSERTWGYRFGVDGLMTFQEVMKHLAIGRTAVFELIEKQEIRKGRPKGESQQRRYRICKRSVLDYCASLED